LSLDTYHVVRKDFSEKLCNDIWTRVYTILVHLMLVVCFDILLTALIGTTQGSASETTSCA